MTTKTVQVPLHLHKELKKLSIDLEQELRVIIETALSEWLKQKKSANNKDSERL